MLRDQSQSGGMGAEKHTLLVPHTFWTCMDLPVIESQRINKSRQCFAASGWKKTGGAGGRAPRIKKIKKFYFL